VGHERPCGAARPGVFEVWLAARDRDEEVTGPDPARVDLDACDGVRIALETSKRERPHLGERQRNQVLASNALRASFAASRSSKGMVLSANSCPCSAPLPATRTTSPGRARSTARAIAAARSSSTSTSPPAPDGLEAAANRVVGDAESARREQRPERVLGVEAALELEVDTVERSGICPAERDRLGELLREPPAVLVAGVDHRDRPRVGEEEP